MLNDLFKRPRHLVQQSVERMLKQILKPFKYALTRWITLCSRKAFIASEIQIEL